MTIAIGGCASDGGAAAGGNAALTSSIQASESGSGTGGGEAPAPHVRSSDSSPIGGMPQPGAKQASRPAAPATTTHDAAVRRQTELELGADAASTLPQVPEGESAQPIDPGAAIVARSIADSLADRRTAGDSVTISLAALQNLSRSNAEEFRGFVSRFAELLTRAGREYRIGFVAEADATTTYRMLGTAYLVNANGFDQWEMYLSLTPTDRDWQVWDARNAIRVLRTARAGQPQITYIGK